MKVIVPHYTTIREAVVIVDRSADGLFESVTSSSVRLANRRRGWSGPRMDFSLTARVGFISMPIAGKVIIDDLNVTVHCDLPAVVKTFVGEDKIRAGVERKIRAMLATSKAAG